MIVLLTLARIFLRISVGCSTFWNSLESVAETNLELIESRLSYADCIQYKEKLFLLILFNFSVVIS